MKGIAKFSKFTSKFEIAVSTALMAGILIVGTIQVIMRYVFNNSLSWSEEVMRYAFIWMVYIGAATTARRRGHVRIELLDNALPGKVKAVLHYCIDILVVAGLCVLVVAGIDLCRRNLTSMTSALVISRAWAYAAIPTGSFCMIVAIICTMITDPYMDKGDYDQEAEAAKAAQEARESLRDEEGKDGET